MTGSLSQALLTVSFISYFLVIVGLVYFVVRYSRTAKLNMTELFWGAVPVAILFTVFLWGLGTFQDHFKPGPERQVGVQVKR